MMDGNQKSWLDATPSKTAFAFGLVLGVGISSLAAFIILLSWFVPSRTGGALGDAGTPPAAVQPSANGGGTAPPAKADIKLTAADHTIGPKNAKVTVVEYSDFQCPFCSRFEPSVQQMLKEYKDKIQFSYRHFPLDAIHPNARPAAIASECAAEQGKFYEYHKIMFEKQEQLGDAFYQQTAKDLKLNVDKFNECLKSDLPSKKVDADYQSGLAAGVQGTPTTFVNGSPVSGAQPYELLKSAIDAALKG
jgi:protein-disulfide isomerase